MRRRYAFVMQIKPELKDEYKVAHDEIWPDMARAIRQSGIRNYSIFFREDGTLFAYLESNDPDRSFEWLNKTEVNTRWQKAMEKYFVKKDPSAKGAEVKVVEEVFHLD